MEHRITLEWLEERNACEKQVEAFRQEWGDSVELTQESLSRAAELKLDLNWLAERYLAGGARRVYDEAMAEPRRVYDEVMTEPRRVCNEAMAEVDRVYDEVMTEADRVYNEAMAEPDRVYDEAMAEALWEALSAGN